MRILWIAQTLYTSKAGGMISNTSRIEMPRHLKKKGCDVHLVLGGSIDEICHHTTPKGEKEITYLPMVNSPFLTTISFQLFFSLLLPLFLLRDRPDIILIDHFSILSILPWALLRRVGLMKCLLILDLRTLPVDISGWHGRLTDHRFNLSVRFAKLFFDGITMITPKMRDLLCKRLAITQDMIGIWESGADIEKFNVARSRRRELGWQDKFVVMYHGVLSPNRGLQNAVRSLSMLKLENPDVLFCLLGSGPAQTELEILIRELRLEDCVVIHPPVRYSEIADYVVSADIGLVPLPNIDWWSTSSPMKLMEYLAARKPVIISRIAAHTAVLGDCPAAFYINEITPSAIAEGIRYFYNRRDTLNRLGMLEWEIVSKGYSWESQADRLIGFLSDLLKKRKF